MPTLRAGAVKFSEDVMMVFDPSAARAYSYGERHFDAIDPAEYDIARAEHFFKIASAKDPLYPHVYHELARISFLRGNFRSALARINFQISMHADALPQSYYIRGLIEGYMKDYESAIHDYAYYLQFDPHNWAAQNDYAWVLLKAKRPKEAAVATREALAIWPENPWLLNTQAIALYEMNAFELAYKSIQKAESAVANITERDWLTAYPGNDPRNAGEGIIALRKSIRDNMHTIQLAAASSTVQLTH